MPARINIIGERYGRLIVKADIKSEKKGRRVLCDCDCGKQAIVAVQELRKGDTKSCGCLRIETIAQLGKEHTWTTTLRHGHSRRNYRTPTYRTWKAMMTRCNNPRSAFYHCYGGRGIIVCDRWKTYENFLQDMGSKPNGLSLDRINNDGNYEPGNCRWATWTEQANNRRPRNSSKRLSDGLAK